MTDIKIYFYILILIVISTVGTASKVDEIQLGYDLILQGKYDSAYNILQPLAKSNDSRAQHRFANLLLAYPAENNPYYDCAT